MWGSYYGLGFWFWRDCVPPTYWYWDSKFYGPYGKVQIRLTRSAEKQRAHRLGKCRDYG